LRGAPLLALPICASSHHTTSPSLSLSIYISIYI
jgi:hypothetical protein